MSQNQKAQQMNTLQHAYDTLGTLLKTKTVATFGEIQAGLNALEFIGRTVNALLNPAKPSEGEPAPDAPKEDEPLPQNQGAQ